MLPHLQYAKRQLTCERCIETFYSGSAIDDDTASSGEEQQSGGSEAGAAPRAANWRRRLRSATDSLVSFAVSDKERGSINGVADDDDDDAPICFGGSDADAAQRARAARRK